MVLPLSRTLALLEQLAPLSHAESWDNVGLLIDPVASSSLAVGRVFVTIELTDEVMTEAIERRADLIVAYHPPIFGGLKRLRQSVVSERIVLRAVSAGVPVYSPHTALDAAPGGVNDWLADAIGRGRRVPVAPAAPPAPSDVGRGRRLMLESGAPLDAIVRRVKEQLGLAHVRVAASARHKAGEAVLSAAVCAGAGGSLLADVHDVDLFLTGEMRYHDVRAKVAGGASVILCDHTHTERGYLPVLAQRLVELSGGNLRVILSARDREPLVVC